LTGGIAAINRIIITAGLIAAFVIISFFTRTFVLKSKRPGAFDSASKGIIKPKAGRPGRKDAYDFSFAKGASKASAGSGSLPGFAKRPGQYIGDRDFEKALDLLDNKNYQEAAVQLISLSSKYPSSSYESMIITYNIAETYFYSKSMAQAKKAYLDFLKRFPDSPLADNARAAVGFIEKFKEYKDMYVSPDVKKGRF
jgi:TolA-binding protein